MPPPDNLPFPVLPSDPSAAEGPHLLAIYYQKDAENQQINLLQSSRFGEALRIVQDKLDSKNFYAFNPEFDRCKK